jgi:hypothetical protein
VTPFGSRDRATQSVRATATFFEDLDFATHAWRRGALDELALCLDTFSSLFAQALALMGVDNVEWRARSIHLYLLGTLNRKLVARVPTDEIAYAVSALAGVALDPERC